MANSTLSHGKSHLVSRSVLATLNPPLSLGSRHQPIPHHVLVDALDAEARSRGFAITRESLAVNAGGHRLFGVFDLTPIAADGGVATFGHALAMGFRNSTDQAMALQVVAGNRVFVCDNMQLSGDLIAVRRRNTVGVNLDDVLAFGFQRFMDHASALDLHNARLQASAISDMQAKAKIVDVFGATIFAATPEVVPMRLFKAVTEYYFKPSDDMLDCQPRSLYGLHNAFTRALKELSPVRAFAANVQIGKAFGLVSGGADVIDASTLASVVE